MKRAAELVTGNLAGLFELVGAVLEQFERTELGREQCDHCGRLDGDHAMHCKHHP